MTRSETRRMYIFRTKEFIEIIPIVERYAPLIAKILSQNSVSLSLKMILPLLFEIFNVNNEKEFCERIKSEQYSSGRILSKIEKDHWYWIDQLIKHNCLDQTGS